MPVGVRIPRFILSTYAMTTRRDRAKMPQFAGIAGRLYWGYNSPGAPPDRQRSENSPVNGPVDLARLGWLVTVLAALVTVLILVIQGYLGYAGVALTVAISAGINLR